MPDQRLLVVGTTPDYIDIIRTRFGGQALFLTDYALRSDGPEMSPFFEEEILCDLKNFDQTLSDLNRRLLAKKIHICGLSCFDCESLELAAYLANALRLRFPSLESISRCRNKFLTKQLWKRAAILCPEAILVEDAARLAHIGPQFNFPVILKPLTGSGSELIFKCADLNEAGHAIDVIQRQLAVHPNTRMYGKTKNPEMDFNARKQILVEQFIDGVEYSCDFMLAGDKLEIIRLASKIPALDQTAGTTLAYVIPGPGMDPERVALLSRQLHGAARALGLDHAVCMADFIVSENRIFLLEITPRPGGDCLPQLIMASSGLDTIGLALHFSAQKSVAVPAASEWKTRVGVRIFASRAGVLQDIDAGALCGNDAIIACNFTASPGFRIELPPKNYDLRVLGHVIFRPDPALSIESQCNAIVSNIVIKIEE